MRLRVAWFEQRPDLARDVMKAQEKPPTLVGLIPVRDAFVEVYESRSPEQALSDARTFLESGVEPSLTESIAEGFALRGRPEHCAKILELPIAPPLHQLSNDVEAYKCRKQAQGEEAALAWLTPRAPPNMREPMVMFAYQHDAPELLSKMEFPDEGKKSAGSDYLWAMRAASAIRAREVVAPEVIEHFKAERGTTGYAAIGRFLVGELGRSALIATATDDRSTNEVAYYLGLDAELHGRVAEAFVWYRASVETNVTNSGEWRLAKDRLYLLNRSPLPLSQLGAIVALTEPDSPQSPPASPAPPTPPVPSGSTAPELLTGSGSVDAPAAPSPPPVDDESSVEPAAEASHTGAAGALALP